MLDEHEIEKIIFETSCNKDFTCRKSGFSDLCKVDIVTNEVLICLDDRAKRCNSSYSYGYGHICKCQLRKYIARKLGQ